MSSRRPAAARSSAPIAAATRDVDDAGAADQQVQRQRVDAARVVEEVFRRVDMRAGVGAEHQARDVRTSPVGDALDRLELELGIARIGRHAGRQRYADVQQFRHTRHKGAMIPFGASNTARWSVNLPVRRHCPRDSRGLLGFHLPNAAFLFFGLVTTPLLAGAPQAPDRREQTRADDALRREGEAIIELADTAMNGRATPSDFSIEWRNDFLKAQPGTFVPFTVTIDPAIRGTTGALMYVRVVARNAPSAEKRRPRVGRSRTKRFFPSTSKTRAAALYGCGAGSPFRQATTRSMSWSGSGWRRRGTGDRSVQGRRCSCSRSMSLISGPGN